MVDQVVTPSAPKLEELPSLDEVVQPAKKEAPEVAVKEAGDKEVKGDEKTAPKYSEAELTKRLSGLQSQKDNVIKELETKVQRLQEENALKEEKALEDRLDNWLKTVEEDGGDLTSAKAVAQAQRDLARQDKEAKQRIVEIAKRESDVQAGLKVLTAYDLVKQYELGQDTVEELLKAENPEAMEKVALVMKLEEVKAGKTPSAKIDPGAGDTKGMDVSKMRIEERLGLFMEESERQGRPV